MSGDSKGAQRPWITFLSESTKRNLVFYGFGLAPGLLYFHRHRKVFLASKHLRQSASYYNPEMAKLGKDSWTREHHLKDLVARVALGFGVSWFL